MPMFIIGIPEMNNKKTPSYLVFISIFTLVTVLIMIAHKSYDNLVRPTEVVMTSENVKPLNTTIDLSVLEEIEKREELVVQDLNVGLPVTPDYFEDATGTPSAEPQ